MFITLIALLGFLIYSSVSETHNRILLQNVRVLTLKKGEYTDGRRTDPVPQLKCVGGSGSNEADKVDTVQCRNVGFDGKDYNWECKSQLPKHLKLGKTEVYCEG